MFYERILRELSRRKIQYLIVGGVAVNLHGYPRLTGDLDIVLCFEKSNIENFGTLLKKLGWLPRVPVSVLDLADAKKREGWLKEKGMKVFSMHNPDIPMEALDVLTDPGFDFGVLKKHSTLMSYKDFKVRVASLDDLIAMKKKAGRKKDLMDVQALDELRRIKKHAAKNKK